MAVGNINVLVRCNECRHADAYGRGCKFGLMFPSACVHFAQGL